MTDPPRPLYIYFFCSCSSNMKLKDKPVVIPFMEMYVCALIYRVICQWTSPVAQR